MIYYNLSVSGDKLKISPDELVKQSSEMLSSIMGSIEAGGIEDAVFYFYWFANLGRQAFLVKSLYPQTVTQARDSADAYEFYMEALKEGSGIVQTAVSEKFGSLVNVEVMQKIATFASEEDSLTNKKIRKHIKRMIPAPRKSTRRKS